MLKLKQEAVLGKEVVAKERTKERRERDKGKSQSAPQNYEATENARERRRQSAEIGMGQKLRVRAGMETDANSCTETSNRDSRLGLPRAASSIGVPGHLMIELRV